MMTHSIRSAFIFATFIARDGAEHNPDYSTELESRLIYLLGDVYCGKNVDVRIDCIYILNSKYYLKSVFLPCVHV